MRDFPAQMDDSLLTDMINLNKEMVVSVSMITMDKGEALRLVHRRKDAVEADIGKRTRSASRDGNWNAVVPQHLQDERANCEYLFDCINEQDERLVMAQVSLVHIADSIEELNTDTQNIKTIATTKSCELSQLRYRQERGLNATLPFDLEYINQRRILSSENCAFLMPFQTKELFDTGGVVYGTNEVSNNLIVINRKGYKNGNAFVFGVPGSGKSLTIKAELENVFFRHPDDDIIVLDPDGEYRPLIDGLGGQLIQISATSEHHINVMDVGDYDRADNPITVKTLFIDALIDIIMRGGLTAAHKSVTGRCVGKILSPLMQLKSRFTHEVPTLKTLYEELKKQDEPAAKEVALALELYTEGALTRRGGYHGRPLHGEHGRHGRRRGSFRRKPHGAHAVRADLLPSRRRHYPAHRLASSVDTGRNAVST